MSADVVAWILAAVMVLSVGLLLRFALRSARAHEARHQEGMALYRRGLDLSQTGQELQTESNSLMRELIGELRASRPTPGAPPASEKLSN